MDPESDYEEENYEEQNIDQYQENEDPYDSGQYAQDQMYQMEQDVDLHLEPMKSVKNPQYNLNELLQTIGQEVFEINNYVQFGQQLTLLYYFLCGWNREMCTQLINQQQKHVQIINYNMQFADSHGPKTVGPCDVCCEEGTILQNYCGHQFCQNCWEGHILQRFKTYFSDPFPPCIFCQTKTSPKVIQYLEKKNPQIHKLYSNIVCRSYSRFNSFVKVCKGRPGIECNRCFSITKQMFEAIQCDTCGNLVCPRCGEEFHGLSECYDLGNWKKVTEDSTEFMDVFNYKTCPNCKEAVERRSGCNSIICPCKTEFCFICGEKWFPNHKAHGDQSCYRFKEIMELREQQKAAKQKGKQYFLEIEDLKTQLDTLTNKYKHIDEINKKIDDHFSVLLKHWPIYKKDLEFVSPLLLNVKKGLLFAKGWKLSFHFRPNESNEASCASMISLLDSMTDFAFDFFEKYAILYLKPKNEWHFKEKKAHVFQGLQERLKDELKTYSKKMSSFQASLMNYMVE